MLSKKLNKNTNEIYNSVTIGKRMKTDDDTTSKYFSEPFWKHLYNIEVKLNKELSEYKYESKIVTHFYNPIEYAADLHCAYLKMCLNQPKNVMMIGMNPGPNGMMQTGVPFGNIKTVRELMKLNGTVNQPTGEIHPKRPILGLACSIEEPSGVRFWNLLNNLSGNLETFSQQCFVHNFCPIAFFDKQGHNITPSELKGNDKKIIRDICLKYLKLEIELVKPIIIIAIGSYVNDALKFLQKSQEISKDIKFLLLPHPSPRSLNNTNWPEKAQKFFEDNDLIKYFKNEV